MALVRSGVPTPVELHARDAGQKLNSLSIAISEPQNSPATWEVRVEALLFERAATRELGRVDTIAPVVTQIPSRVVAIASCPGCRGFRVTVFKPVTEGGPYECNVELGELPYLHSAPGLVAIEPHAIIHGQRYSYLSGTAPAGNSQVGIARNARVHTVSVIAPAAGGSFALGAPGVFVPLPANVGVQIAPRGLVRGPTAVQFSTIPAPGAPYIIELTT